jgi:hypothetical protein
MALQRIFPDGYCKLKSGPLMLSPDRRAQRVVTRTDRSISYPTAFLKDSNLKKII